MDIHATKTDWLAKTTCNGFEAYRDLPEQLIGYRWLIQKILATGGQKNTILDYGCGPGKVSLRLAESGCGDVIGIDQSAAMLDIARQQRAHHRIDYRHIINDQLDLSDASVDFVLACFVIINNSSIDRIRTIFSNAAQVLKPGGRFFILDTNPDTTGIVFSTFTSGDAGAVYKTGQTRTVSLHVPGQADLVLRDFYWPKELYVDMLNEAGFANVCIYEPTLNDVPEAERLQFEERTGFSEWKGEYNNAPFVIFEASH